CVKTTIATQICADHPLLELLVVLRHEKHPKGWIGIQLLGCSSRGALFSYPAMHARTDGAGAYRVTR
ncbi:hypothetical protein KTE62_28435, partial [Burkholderia multivorans]|uniref:hypothetical protein n=1 Tax=Burkholderia multivorans TaxID=87883 RepID=UPI001C228DED